MLCLGVACGSSPQDSASAKPAVTQPSDCDVDTGGGHPTWAGFASGFFAGRCAACHSEDTPNRFGAPEGIDFDSEAHVEARLEDIQRAVLDNETMPPGGGLLDSEKDRLEQYLACLREG